MDIDFVQQRCDKGCGVACMAMVSGESFDKILGIKGGIPETYPSEFDSIFKELGVKYERQLIPHLEENSLYIVTVPSINIKRMLHYIVVKTYSAINNGNNINVDIYDPNKGRGNEFYGDGENTLDTYAEVIEILGL